MEILGQAEIVITATNSVRLRRRAHWLRVNATFVLGLILIALCSGLYFFLYAGQITLGVWQRTQKNEEMALLEQGAVAMRAAATKLRAHPILAEETLRTPNGARKEGDAALPKLRKTISSVYQTTEQSVMRDRIATRKCGADGLDYDESRLGVDITVFGPNPGNFVPLQYTTGGLL